MVLGSRRPEGGRLGLNVIPKVGGVDRVDTRIEHVGRGRERERIVVADGCAHTTDAERGDTLDSDGDGGHERIPNLPVLDDTQGRFHLRHLEREGEADAVDQHGGVNDMRLRVRVWVPVDHFFDSHQ